MILAGNSMEGMVSLLEASAAPATVAGLVLIDPVLSLAPAIPDHFVTPILTAYAAPWLGPLLMRRRRLSPEDLADSILRDAPRVLASLERIGRAPGDVRAIVLTHAHPDHLGGSERLRAGHGIPVRMLSAEAPHARAGEARADCCALIRLHGSRA